MKISHRYADIVGRNWTTVNGLQLHSLVSKNRFPAQKTPVILVQGIGMSSRYMMPALAELAPHFEVFAPDLPGFGRSEKSSKVLDIVELSDALAAWMRAVRITRAVLVGHSLGGQIVAEFAVRHPEMLERAVLVAPTFDAQARSFFPQFWRLLRDALNEPFSLYAIAIFDYFRFGLIREIRTLRYGLQDRIEDKLPQMRVPTLVVRGSLDPVVPPRWAEEVTSLLPQGRLATIPGGTHGVNYSRPAIFAEVVRQFIKDESFI